MKYIEPLSLTMDSEGNIIVQAVCDGETVDYKFTSHMDSAITGVTQEDAFYFKTYNDPLAAYWLTKSTKDLIKAHHEKVTLTEDKALLQPIRIKFSPNTIDSADYLVDFAPIAGTPLEETFTVSGTAPTYTIAHRSHQWTTNMHPRKWILSAEESITPLLSAILSLHHARALK